MNSARSVAGGFGFAALLAACAGAGAPATGGGPTSLSVSPSSVSFGSTSYVPPAQTITVTESGGSALITAKVSGPQYVNVSPASAPGPSATFTVRAVAGAGAGTAQGVTFSTGSATAAVPVSVGFCLPPIPLMEQSYPIAGATVPADASAFIYAVPNGEDPSFYGFTLRLIAADGSAADGSQLGPPPSPLPSPMATPFFANPSYLAASPPPMQTGTSYQAELYAANLRCLPPVFLTPFNT